MRSGGKETLDGISVDSLLVAWEPYYAASNRPARLRAVSRAMTRGETGPVRVTAARSAGPFELTAERIPLEELDLESGFAHDLPGDEFQMLTDDVAYLKLSSVVFSKVEDYIREAGGAIVLVVDIRNYPSAFVVFELGERLVEDATPFARFTSAAASSPTWRPARRSPGPGPAAMRCSRPASAACWAGSSGCRRDEMRPYSPPKHPKQRV